MTTVIVKLTVRVLGRLSKAIVIVHVSGTVLTKQGTKYCFIQIVIKKKKELSALFDNKIKLNCHISGDMTF